MHVHRYNEEFQNEKSLSPDSIEIEGQNISYCIFGKQCILTRESRIINIGSYADIFNNLGMSITDLRRISYE